jgi:HSP20 family molecular chaperone IbpA
VEVDANRVGRTARRRAVDHVAKSGKRAAKNQQSPYADWTHQWIGKEHYQPAAEQTVSAGPPQQVLLPSTWISWAGRRVVGLANVPGAKSAIEVNFKDSTLEIWAAMYPGTATARRALQEYGVGDYCRSFQISEVIDAGKISADYADGVLTLHLPKTEAVKPRKIAVASA